METGRSDGFEFPRILPLLFVCSIIVFLFFSYTFLHCYPLLQIGVEKPDKADVEKGAWRLTLFLALTIMLLICYVRCIVVGAGTIPDTADWIVGSGTENSEIPANVQETKGDGGRRKCKWCGKYKPDRCHHCRVCRICVLKMDHHCPWIYNCVGFNNHKYFFLLLFYSCGVTHLISWTMWETVKSTTERETSFWKMFLVLFSETLAVFFCGLITLFFIFHLSLMLNGMTTIEYCEKTIKKENYNQSIWDLGIFGNLKAVFGPNVLLWLFPCSPSEGNGMNYVTERSRLTVDMEAGKGLRKLHAQERNRRRANKKDGTMENSMESNSSGDQRDKSQNEQRGQGSAPPRNDSPQILIPALPLAAKAPALPTLQEGVLTQGSSGWH